MWSELMDRTFLDNLLCLGWVFAIYSQQESTMPTTHVTDYDYADYDDYETTVHRFPPRSRPSHTRTSSRPKLDYTEVTIL